MESIVVSLQTGSRRGAFDVTPQLADFAAGRGDGLLSAFVPHATAGLAILETGAGSDQDFLDLIDRLVERRDDLYRHRHGSPGHGADHVIPGLVSPSVTIPVIGGRMTLGTWQAVVFFDPNADNATRQLRLSFLQG
jgi:secondary thiamine-phosphate synthase enzyme